MTRRLVTTVMAALLTLGGLLLAPGTASAAVSSTPPATPQIGGSATSGTDGTIEVVRQLTGGRDHLTSVSDGGIEGLVFHAAGAGDDGFWVIDVWESREAVERFGLRVAPIAQAAGITEPMKSYRIHTVLGC